MDHVKQLISLLPSREAAFKILPFTVVALGSAIFGKAVSNHLKNTSTEYLEWCIRMSTQCEDKGDVFGAIRYMKKAIKRTRNWGSEPDQARALMIQHWLLNVYELPEYENYQIDLLEQTLKLHDRVHFPKNSNRVYVCAEYGKVLLSQGKIQESIQYLEESLKYGVDSTFRKLFRLETIFVLAVAYAALHYTRKNDFRANYLEKATEYLKAGLGKTRFVIFDDENDLDRELQQNPETQEELCTVVEEMVIKFLKHVAFGINLPQTEEEAPKLSTSHPIINELIEYASSHSDQWEEQELVGADVHAVIGRHFLEQGDQQMALQHYNRASEIAVAIKNVQRECEMLLSLSEVHYKKGNYNEGLSLCQKALDAWEKYLKEHNKSVPSPPEKEVPNNNNNNLYTNPQQTQAQKKQCDSWGDPKIDPVVAAACVWIELYGLCSVGKFQYALGNFSGAVEILNQASKKSVQYNFMYWYCISQSLLFDVLQALEDKSGLIDAAVEHQVTSRKLKLMLGRLSDKTAGHGLLELAIAVIEEDESQASLSFDLLEKALKRAENIRDWTLKQKILETKAELASRVGRWDEAIQHHDSSLNLLNLLHDQHNLGKSLLGKARTFMMMQDYDKATVCLQEALELFERTKNRLDATVAKKELSVAFFRLGNVEKSESIIREALRDIESLRNDISNKELKIFFGRSLRHYYATLEMLLVAQGKHTEALEISEKSRARAFAELVKTRVVKSRQMLKRSALVVDNELRAESIKDIAARFNTTLVEYSIHFEYQQTKYVEREIFVWVITPGGEIHNCVIPLMERGISLRIVVENFIKELTADPRANPVRSCEAMYDLLIAPIEEHLPKNGTDYVTFIPQDSLFLVPFNALRNPKTGTYVIDQYTVMTSPSIQIFDIINKKPMLRKEDDQKVLIVGNPWTPDQVSLKLFENFAYLLGIQLRTEPLTGRAATKKKVLKEMKESTVAHLSAHGLIAQGVNHYDVTVRLGAVALCPEDKDNGVLRANDIVDLDLEHMDLVFLHGCFTASGSVNEGEGLVSLSRSFLEAGVSGIVNTLWSIYENPSAYFGMLFYRNLEVLGNTAAALRAAALEVRRIYPEPVHWAPYVFMGNPNVNFKILPKMTEQQLDVPAVPSENFHVRPDVKLVQQLKHVYKFTDPELVRLQEVFEQFAVPSPTQKYLTRQRFLHALDVLFPLHDLDLDYKPVRWVLLDLLFNVFDKNENDLLDFEEFVSGLHIWCKCTDAERSTFLFEAIDKDKDRVITIDELNNVVFKAFVSEALVLFARAKAIEDEQKRKEYIAFRFGYSPETFPVDYEAEILATLIGYSRNMISNLLEAQKRKINQFNMGLFDRYFHDIMAKFGFGAYLYDWEIFPAKKMHYAVSCQGCLFGPIQGSRYVCHECAGTPTLCSKCVEKHKTVTAHNPTPVYLEDQLE